MAFILLSSRSVTRSGVKALSLRHVLIGSAVACTLVGTGTFALGVLVGRVLENDNAAASVAQNSLDPAQQRFTFERLGTLTGRVLSLESNATTLIKKIGALDSLERKLGELQNNTIKGKKIEAPIVRDAGGPMMAPRGCEQIASKANEGTPGQQLVQTEKTIECLQQMLSEVDAAATARSVAYMAVPSRRPVNTTEIGSPFGNRVDPINGQLAFHPGLDFPAPIGTAIFAAGGGRVKYAGPLSDLGNVVEIDHGNGLVTRYAHTSKVLVKTGDVVAPRQEIALVGSTGRSTGPHLHFEVIHDGRYVDPEYYLKLGGS